MTKKTNLRQRLPAPEFKKLLDRVRDLILLDDFKSDQYVTARQIQMSLGGKGKYSLNHVRSAILMLEVDGLLEMMPQQGAKLYTPPLQSVQALIDFRVQNETYAAFRISELNEKDKTERIRELKVINAELRELADDKKGGRQQLEKTSRAFREGDHRFHLAIFEAADYEHTSHVLVWLRQRLARALDKNFRSSDFRFEVCQEHEVILRAITFNLEELIPRPSKPDVSNFGIFEKAIRRSRIEAAFRCHLENSINRTRNKLERETQVETELERCMIQCIKAFSPKVARGTDRTRPRADDQT